MGNTFIYTLSDPRTGLIRYVGKTFNFKTRRKSHLFSGGRPDNKKCAWVNLLKTLNLKPLMEVIEIVDSEKEEDWALAERFWISTLRFYGFDLLNADDGGNSGKRLDADAKRKIAIKSKARMTPEEKERLRIKLTGMKMHTIETKRIISESKLGKPRPDSVRAALLEGSRQWKLSQGFTPNITCVSCHKVIKVNRLKSGLPNDKQKWFREGVGYIHNLCLKKCKNSHSAKSSTSLEPITS